MRKIYEVGDVFKLTYLSGTIEYYMIVATDKSLIYKLINLADGCGFEESMEEENLTKFIDDEDFEYIGQAKDIVEIKDEKEE